VRISGGTTVASSELLPSLPEVLPFLVPVRAARLSVGLVDPCSEREREEFPEEFSEEGTSKPPIWSMMCVIFPS
jgi:hypothetical protein